MRDIKIRIWPNSEAANRYDVEIDGDITERISKQGIKNLVNTLIDHKILSINES